MGNVIINNINTNIPVQGLANDSAKIRENFRIIKDALNQANAEIATLQYSISAEGPIGPTGPIGPQGGLGPTGPQGVQGLQGTQGIMGRTGPTGAAGINGNDGPTGATGAPSFIPGPKGDRGEVGPMGPTGPSANVTIANKNRLGIVQVGGNISVNESGVIDINSGNVINALGYIPVSNSVLQTSLVNINAITLNGYTVGVLPDNIVKLDPDGKLPALDGSKLILPEPGKLIGLQPVVVNNSVISISSGVCTDYQASTTMTVMPGTPININLLSTQKGLGALDRGTVTVNQSYYIYIVKNPTSGIVGALASRATTVDQVALPSGFTKIRKLPWGITYGPSGLRPVQITGWPTPFTQFLTPITLVTSGPTNGWINLSLANYIPANAQKVFLNCTLAGQGGVGMTATEGTYLAGGALIISGVPLNVQSPQHSIQAWVPTTSNRSIVYYVGWYGAMIVDLVGYQQTEIS